jgi:hypothetical protein
MDGWNGSDVCYGRASALNVSVSQRNGTRDGQAESCATGKNLRDAVQKSASRRSPLISSKPIFPLMSDSAERLSAPVCLVESLHWIWVAEWAVKPCATR